MEGMLSANTASCPGLGEGRSDPAICARVIHLPQQEGRKLRFLAQNRVDGLGFAFVDGVDGRCVDIPEMVRQGLILPGTRRYTLSALGCALAHRTRWLEALTLGTPTFVCEDDAVFRSDCCQWLPACLGAVPTDWDFLLLGYNVNSVLEFEFIPGVEGLRGRFVRRSLREPDLCRFQADTTPVSALPLVNAFGTPAYAISAQGARRLLSDVFPLHNRLVEIPALGRAIETFSIDSIMNYLYKRMKAFVCFPPLVLSPNRKDPLDREALVPGSWQGYVGEAFGS
jgi:glycosyl transferase, family 25